MSSDDAHKRDSILERIVSETHRDESQRKWKPIEHTDRRRKEPQLKQRHAPSLASIYCPRFEKCVGYSNKPHVQINHSHTPTNIFKVEKKIFQLKGETKSLLIRNDSN